MKSVKHFNVRPMATAGHGDMTMALRVPCVGVAPRETQGPHRRGNGVQAKNTVPMSHFGFRGVVTLGKLNELDEASTHLLAGREIRAFPAGEVIA